VLLELAAFEEELAVSPPAPPAPPVPAPELVVLSVFTSSEHAAKAPPRARHSRGMMVEEDTRITVSSE
jgi:hypothetical protein